MRLSDVQNTWNYSKYNIWKKVKFIPQNRGKEVHISKSN